MSFLQKILGKKTEEQRVGGMEDFMTLVRVYFQASLATTLGIWQCFRICEHSKRHSVFLPKTINLEWGRKANAKR